jgi:hypothetical protein
LKDRSSLTSESKLETFHEDPPLVIRHNPVKLPFLHLTFSSSTELEESSLEKSKSLKAAHARYMLLELLLLLVSKVVVLLVVTLVARVVPIGVVILVGGVELLPLGAVGDEVGGVDALKAALGWPPPLLAKLVQGTELPRQQCDLIIGDALVLRIRSCSQRRQGKLQSR